MAFVPCGGTSYPPTDVYTYDVSNFDIHQSHLNANSAPDKDAFTNSTALDQGGIEGTFQYVYGASTPSFLAKFYLVDTAGDGSYQDGFFDSNGNGSYDSGEPVYCHITGGTSCLPAPGIPVMRTDAVIASAATAKGINPKLLIVKLQVEQSLVHVLCNTSCSSFPSYTTLNKATGCAGTSWFYKQVNCAAQTFIDRYNDAVTGTSSWPYFFPINTGASYDASIKLAYSAACQDTGGHLVTGCTYVGLAMNDAATEAQYNYTPYVQAATNCGGGVCLFETTYYGYSFLW